MYELAGFTGAEADRAATAVFTYVLGNALGPAAAASFSRKLGREGGRAEELMRESLSRARDIAAQSPRLQARLDTAAAEYGAAPALTFEFGLGAILDGLEAALADRHAPGGPSGRESHRGDQETPAAPGSAT